MTICSPKRTQELGTNSNSCYNNNELIAIAKAYNQALLNDGVICNLSNSSNKTCSQPKLIKMSNNINELYKELSDNLRKLTKKGGEDSWLSLDFINNIKDRNLKESLLHFTFKPIGPVKENDWLNTSNINEVEQQYLDLYKSKNFTFLGAQPSDYSKIKRINYTHLRKSNNYIGIIFNTDPHNKPGVHWVSVFIDNRNKIVDYFDSLGNNPNKNICSFLKHFKNYHFNFNKVKHQKAGAQCGVYACFFLNQRLKGITMADINKQIISDKMMIAYRKEIFR
jgi:hypothetical protein